MQPKRIRKARVSEARPEAGLSARPVKRREHRADLAAKSVALASPKPVTAPEVLLAKANRPARLVSPKAAVLPKSLPLETPKPPQRVENLEENIKPKLGPVRRQTRPVENALQHIVSSPKDAPTPKPESIRKKTSPRLPTEGERDLTYFERKNIELRLFWAAAGISFGSAFGAVPALFRYAETTILTLEGFFLTMIFFANLLLSAVLGYILSSRQKV